MRCLLVALGLLGLVADARAADLPTLRGSDSFLPSTPGYVRWEGFYVGGQFTYGDLNANFVNATNPPTDFGRPLLGLADVSTSGFGGFVGYNTQWDDIVVGLELNYSHSALDVTSFSTPVSGTVVSGGSTYGVSVAGSGTLKIDDIAVLRARAGWVTGSFMPYATFGLAMGNANINLASTVTFQNMVNPIPNPAPACTLAPCTTTQLASKNSEFVYGYAMGGGLDVALTQNIFARAEYEYIAWSPIWAISTHLNTARLGLGLKF